MPLPKKKQQNSRSQQIKPKTPKNKYTKSKTQIQDYIPKSLRQKKQINQNQKENPHKKKKKTELQCPQNPKSQNLISEYSKPKFKKNNKSNPKREHL